MTVIDLFKSHKPLVMGILNVTPDSFSDGGKFNSLETALAHGEDMIEAGVDIIDIGGQSTRLGYVEVSPEVEIERLVDIIKAIRKISDVAISIDTYFPQVAQETIQAGADIINDIKGGDQGGMLEVIQANPHVGYIYMHSRPTQEMSIQQLSDELFGYQDEMLEKFQKNNISLERTSFDPGVGVGWKTYDQHIALMKDPVEFCYFDRGPVLYGVSRKRTIAEITGHTDPLKRDTASVVTHLLLAERGVKILRVHDFQGLIDAFKVYEAIKPGGDNE